MEEECEEVDENIIEYHFEREFETVKDAEDLDTTIVTQASELKKDLSPQDVKKIFTEKKIKYTISAGSRYKAQNVEMMVMSEKLRESGENIKVVSTSEF